MATYPLSGDRSQFQLGNTADGNLMLATSSSTDHGVVVFETAGAFIDNADLPSGGRGSMASCL